MTKDDSPIAFVRNQAIRLVDLMAKCPDDELRIELLTYALRTSFYQGFRDGASRAPMKNV